MFEGDIHTEAIKIHYYRTGGDRPPLVLAHGFSDNGACWASLLPELSSSFEIITYDARSHGHSGSVARPYNSEDQADDLLALIDQLELERPVLMGHSMGGQTIGWVSAKRPDLPRALIFEDSGLTGPVPETARERSAQQRARTGMHDWVADLQQKSVDDLIEICRQNSPSWPEIDRRPWAESKLQLDLPGIAELSFTSSRDLREFFADISCPTLFLKADTDSAERHRHRKIVERIPLGRIVHIDGAGHNVRRDCHEESVRVLRQFTDSV